MDTPAETPAVKQSRSQPSRSLWALIAGVGVLLIAGIATAVLVSHRDTATHYPPNSPQGTVQRYLARLQSGQVDTAYDMITTGRSSSDFHAEYDNWSSRSHRVTLVRSNVRGDTASVVVDISSFQAGPFDASSNSQRVTFTLTRQGHGWLITGPDFLPY